jgi:hypothetical protein
MSQIFLALFMSINAHAVDLSACDSLTLTGFKSCLKEFLSSTKSAGKPVAPICNETRDAGITHLPPLAEKFYEKGASCDEFIKKDGSYGVYGKIILEYLKEEGKNSIFFQDHLSGVEKSCPGWSKMNLEEKQYYFVWVKAAISHKESTCDPKARVNATNGVAVGLLQLDEKLSNRKWRGPNCNTKNILNIKSNLRCGLDIFKELLKGKEGEYKGSGELWGKKSNSYWEQLRLKNGGEIAKLISLNPVCKK